MAVEIGGQKRRIGLALSGGGFRAAAFHLGVMRKLQELKLLDKIDALSCVSGGSIAGGHLAVNWGRPDVLETLENYLSTRSIAVASFIGGAIDPFHSRLEKLADSYDRDLFQARTLSALRTGPRVYFLATNLATGNMFFFVAGADLPEEMGEWELGTASASSFPISHAVAASSAFPPVFPPLRLGPDVYPQASAVEYVTLADGGVYDNMGVNPLLRQKRANLDYIIISDGGKPFAINEQPTESGAVVLRASLDIMMEQIRGLEFDRIQHRHLANQGPKPLWFSIDSVEGEAQPGDAAFASAVGTNLKRLSPPEMSVLMRHGGALLDARIDRYAPELKTVVQ
jgi:NTE family protein